MEFEQTRRAPVTTAQVTAQIERLILRRVKDKAWDDVERKIKPVTDPYQYKKKLLLDQEKSKLSLAQIYEQVSSQLAGIANSQKYASGTALSNAEMNALTQNFSINYDFFSGWMLK